MTLKVVGAGVGRTGTASLKIAFERLGFGRRRERAREVFGGGAAPAESRT